MDTALPASSCGGSTPNGASSPSTTCATATAAWRRADELAGSRDTSLQSILTSTAWPSLLHEERLRQEGMSVEALEEGTNVDTLKEGDECGSPQ